MNVSELYLTLEVYAHLRELPQYAALKAEIEKKLREDNDALVPKPKPDEPAPKAPMETSTKAPSKAPAESAEENRR